MPKQSLLAICVLDAKKCLFKFIFCLTAITVCSFLRVVYKFTEFFTENSLCLSQLCNKKIETS